MHVPGRPDFQLELIGHRLQAVGLLVHAVGECVGGFGELALRLLLLHFGLQLGLHLLEAALLGRLDVGHLDDVVAELGFDQAADLALAQRESRVLESLGHGAAGEEVEVAALRGRARVLRVLLRDLGEAVRRLLHGRQQFLGLGLRLVALGRRRVLGHGDQDVAGAALFLAAQARGILLVIGLEVLLVDGDALLDGLQVQHHVFDVGLLGRLELVPGWPCRRPPARRRWG